MLVVQRGPEVLTRERAFEVARELRAKGLRAVVDLGPRRSEAALVEYAARLGLQLLVLAGKKQKLLGAGPLDPRSVAVS